MAEVYPVPPAPKKARNWRLIGGVALGCIVLMCACVLSVANYGNRSIARETATAEAIALANAPTATIVPTLAPTGEPTPTDVPTPTAPPLPTATAAPTETPEPTDSPAPTATPESTATTGPTAVSLASLNDWAAEYNSYAKDNFECCMRAVVVRSDPIEVSVLLSEKLELKTEEARQSIANGLMNNLRIKHGLCLSVVTFLHSPLNPFPDEYTNTKCGTP